MKTLIIVVVIFFIVIIIAERFLRVKYNINRKENTMSTVQKQIQFIGVIILFFGYLGISFALMSKDEELDIVWTLIPFILSLSVFRTFMQWRYNRQANMWITEIFGAVCLIALYSLLLLLMPNL